MAAFPHRTSGRWGVYAKNGKPVAEFTSFISFEYSAESRTATQPVEEGGFFSANKWQTGYEVRVTLAKEGGDSERAAILEALETARQSTDLFDVVTPEKTYLDASIDQISRSAKREGGGYLLIVELVLKEIRQVETAYTNVDLPPAKVKKADDASTKDSGKQQGKQPRESTLSKAKKSLNG